MEPIDLDQDHVRLTRFQMSEELEPKLPEGKGWFLHGLCPEGHPSVGGIWLLFRRPKIVPEPEPAAPPAAEPAPAAGPPPPAPPAAPPLPPTGAAEEGK
jgi:hypothetical protein